MWSWTDGVGWWMMFGGIWMLLFWGVLIALVVWGVLKLSKGTGLGGEKRSPLDIARERYARGEILREEFEQLKKDLS